VPCGLPRELLPRQLLVTRVHPMRCLAMPVSTLHTPSLLDLGCPS
jgi:hypothetical protein